MVLKAIDFASRIGQGKAYFVALSTAFRAGWANAYEAFVEDGRPVVAGLALLHPAWLEEEDASHLEIRGPRAFGPSTLAVGCQSAVLWGYECDGGALETDHMFPYALGGPTRADNALMLCREHNRLKGHDVHLIPWETYSFPWLDEQLVAMRARQAILR